MKSRRFALLGRVVWSVGRFVAPKAYRRYKKKHGDPAAGGKRA